MTPQTMMTNPRVPGSIYARKGRYYWARRLPGETKARVVRIVPAGAMFATTDRAEAEQVARKAGIPYYTDHIEMLDKVKPQGVINATPNKLHVPIGIDCIERGIPVIVEKPVAESIASAKKLVQAAADKGVPVMVGHHRRHNEDNRHEHVAPPRVGFH